MQQVQFASTISTLAPVVQATVVRPGWMLDAKRDLLVEMASFTAMVIGAIQAVAPDLAESLDAVDLDRATRAEWGRLAQLASVRSAAYAGYLHARISGRVLFGEDDAGDDFQDRARVSRIMMDQTYRYLQNDAALDWLALLGEADWWTADATGLHTLFLAAPSDFARGVIAGVVAVRIERGDLA